MAVGRALCARRRRRRCNAPARRMAPVVGRVHGYDPRPARYVCLSYPAALLQLQDQAASRQLTRAWEQWHAKSVHLREQAHVAALTSAWRQRHAAWHVWRHALERCQQDADVAAQYACARRLHTSLTHWRYATRTRKADACVARTQHRMLVHAWDRTYSLLTQNGAGTRCVGGIGARAQRWSRRGVMRRQCVCRFGIGARARRSGRRMPTLPTPRV